MPRERRPRAAEPEGLGSILDQLGAARPLQTGLALGRLGRRWTEAVGERLAAESAPARLDAGVLTVRVSSAGWAAQVRFLAASVAERANEILGERAVREVRVVLDGGPNA
jgi:predicted nucleic acid-binding Zn ribbon protein